MVSRNISLLHLVCSVSGAKFVNKNKQTDKQGKSKAGETCLPSLVSAKIRDGLSCHSNIYFRQRYQYFDYIFQKIISKGGTYHDLQYSVISNQVYLGNALKTFWLVLVKVQRVYCTNKPQRWLKKCKSWTLLPRTIDLWDWQSWIDAMFKTIRVMVMKNDTDHIEENAEWWSLMTN